MNEFINAFIDEFEKIAARKKKEKSWWGQNWPGLLLLASLVTSRVVGNVYARRAYTQWGRQHYQRYGGQYYQRYGRQPGWAPPAARWTPGKAMGTTGINPSMSREQMVGVKRQAALRFHPDRPGGSATKMKDYNEAWQYLKTQGMTKGASIYFYNGFIDELEKRSFAISKGD